MTFSELLGLTATELEQLTDDQLLEYLKPCLVDCPPIDLKIIQEDEAKIKLEKLQKKNEAKEQRKLEKQLAKAKGNIEKTGEKSTTISSIKQKPKVTPEQLAQVNAMMEMMKKQMELMNKPK